MLILWYNELIIQRKENLHVVKKQKWFSLSQASIKLKRGNTYVSVWLRRHPNELPSEMLMEAGRVKLISDEGIEWIKKHIKKEGVLVSNSSANGDQHLEVAILGVTLLIIHFTGRVRGSLAPLWLWPDYAIKEVRQWKLKAGKALKVS